MNMHQRRRSDRAPLSRSAQWKHPWPDEAEWIARCASRIVEMDPACSREEAAAIAREMLAFERTGTMSAEEAIEFVLSEFQKGAAARLERRRSREARPAKSRR